MAAATSLKLREHFYKNLVPSLGKDLGVNNVWALPRLSKVKINVGLGPYISAKKDYSQVLENLAAITGQKPVVTKARKSISNFKIRENMAVGVTVTLRGKRMYDFVSKLVNITFPRIRDFRGISPKGFDGKGNYTVGIVENTVFPEINPDSMDRVHGLQITIVTTADDDKSGKNYCKRSAFLSRSSKKRRRKSQKLTIYNLSLILKENG